jgi:hypothetical protein
MTTKNKKELINRLIQEKEKQLESQDFIEFSSEDLSILDINAAKEIENHFHGHTMMALPEWEVDFFRWLKEKDFSVWNDLWENDEEPYRVSTDFLHHFIKNGNGFPICDLIDEDNYWFCGRHIKPKGLENMEETGKKIKQNKSLSFEEALLIELLRGSIDLWHFCYRYKVPLSMGKERIDQMHQNDILVHLTDREDLVKYLDV